MRPKPVISDLLLEQLALGELPAGLARKIQDELARDPSLRARYDAIAASDREILGRYPPAEIARTIRERLEADPESDPVDAGPSSSLQPVGRWALQLAVGLPAAAVLLIVFSFFMFRERLATDQTRVKGLAPHVIAFLKTAGGARELAPGTLVGRGDVIQLGYTAAEARYGVIFSVDGRGTITWHLPAGFSGSPRSAPALERSGRVMLPTAYELDDAPGFERFFFVSSDRPFEIAAVAQAARALTSRLAAADRTDLVLPPGLMQASFLLKKRGYVS
jgi:hypothetical protein